MGKKLLRILLFFAGFVILFACFNHVMAPKNATEDAGMHEAHAKGFLAEPENTLDVLILGNSEAYRGIAPLTIWEMYGITAYSCGTNDQILYQSEDYLVRALNVQSPQVVFLETDTIFREHNTLDVVSHRLEELFPLIRYHDRWKNLQISDFTDPIRFDAVSQGKGYVYMGHADPADDTGYMTPSDEVESIPKKNIRYVQNIHDLCLDHGAELVLFSTPSTMNWYYGRHNAIVQLAQQLGVAYIDMNLMPEEVPIDWTTDTMDEGNHMNYSGAKKVSAYLGAYLSEKDLFTDKRSDPAFSAWNEAVAAFYAENEIESNS